MTDDENGEDKKFIKIWQPKAGLVQYIVQQNKYKTVKVVVWYVHDGENENKIWMKLTDKYRTTQKVNSNCRMQNAVVSQRTEQRPANKGRKAEPEK